MPSERVLLIALARTNRDRWHKADRLAELEALTLTAGGEVVERVLQIRPDPDPATLIGSGKAQELARLCARHRIELLIFDNALTGSQVRNIEGLTGVRAIDRTTLILDIFARHARTAEAKTQVELAQLEHRASMLTGFGTSLSRLGGGIGTVGPGETKLEVDRRRIRARIALLRKKLEGIDRERAVQRRFRQNLIRVALAGYTNAGKSALMNQLTSASVRVAPFMFSTVDSCTRPLELLPNIIVTLTDTVGFIRDLPHELVTGFRSTLGEIRESDLILLVVDATTPDAEDRIRVVRSTLAEICLAQKPIITVLNKIDRVVEPAILERLGHRFPPSVAVSALTGEGIPALRQAMLKSLRPLMMVRTFRLPQDRPDLISQVYQSGQVISRRVRDSHVLLRVVGLPATLGRLRRKIDNLARS